MKVKQILTAVMLTISLNVFSSSVNDKLTTLTSNNSICEFCSSENIIAVERTKLQNSKKYTVKDLVSKTLNKLSPEINFTDKKTKPRIAGFLGTIFFILLGVGILKAILGGKSEKTGKEELAEGIELFREECSFFYYSKSDNTTTCNRKGRRMDSCVYFTKQPEDLTQKEFRSNCPRYPRLDENLSFFLYGAAGYQPEERTNSNSTRAKPISPEERWSNLGYANKSYYASMCPKYDNERCEAGDRCNVLNQGLNSCNELYTFRSNVLNSYLSGY